MNACPVCPAGEMIDERIETWMRKAGEWVLLRGVPARRCDVCGETTFAQEVAERLANIVAPDSKERPTGSYQAPVFDLQKLDRAQPARQANRPGLRQGQQVDILER
jgi:YgiT-type zinc finger domain-containing protein